MALILITLCGCQTQESLLNSTPPTVSSDASGDESDSNSTLPSVSSDSSENVSDDESDSNSTPPSVSSDDSENVSDDESESVSDSTTSSAPSDNSDDSLDYEFDPNETLPPLSDDEKEIVSAGEINFVYGEIIGKMSPNVLVLKMDVHIMVDTWGEIVYIITDQADEWCVKDEIEIRFSVAERPHDSSQYVRIIADKIHPLVLTAKPIIYLYPEEPTVCSVQLNVNGVLTCTYPDYENGWNDFTAYPDGTLVFPDGKEYYALYWEGIQNVKWDFTQGYCVRGEDTAEFLEWALLEQGLTPREANEFIIYWLPLMQDNPYNVISFQTTTYTDNAVLDISPAPDALLRVFMAYYPTSSEVEIEPQEFEEFDRHGFTVVEWGGAQVKTNE